MVMISKQKSKSISHMLLYILIAVIMALFSTSLVHADSINPKPTRQYVVDDYAHMLNNPTKKMVLNKEKYYRFHTVDKPQIVMMTVNNTNGESIDDYAKDLLANQRWHFGSKKYNNGVLILFAKNNGNNNVRISVGDGIRNILPNSECLQILKSNKSELKMGNNSSNNIGLQGVFNQVTQVLDTRYAHMSKQQLNAMLAQQHKQKVDRDLTIAGIIVVFLIIAIPPYNGHWFCGLKGAVIAFAAIFSILAVIGAFTGDSDDNDSGGGGSFSSGGGASI